MTARVALPVGIPTVAVPAAEIVVPVVLGNVATGGVEKVVETVETI